jgi:hypothetical protein
MLGSLKNTSRLFPRYRCGRRAVRRYAAALGLTAAALTALAPAAPVQAQSPFYWNYTAVKDYSVTYGQPGFTYTNHYRFQYGGILEDGRVAALYSTSPINQRGVALVDINGNHTFSALGRADCLLSASNTGVWTINSDWGHIDPHYIGGTAFAEMQYPQTPISGLYWTPAGSTTPQAALLNAKNEEVPYVDRFFTMNILAASARGNYAAVKTLIRYEYFANDNPQLNVAGDHNYIAVRRFNSANPTLDQEVFGAYHPDNLKSEGGTKTVRGATTKAYSIYQQNTQRINAIGDISVGNTGDIAFAGSASVISGGSSQGHMGIFLWQGGDPYTCPGPADSPFQHPHLAEVSGLSTNGGKVAFRANTNSAIYLTDPFVTKAARIIGVGDVSNGYRFTSIGSRLVLNNGRILFGAKWQPAANPSATPRFGLFVFREGKAYPVVSEGESIEGGVLSKLTAWDMNHSGRVVYSYVRMSLNGRSSAPFIGAAFFYVPWPTAAP